MKVVGRLVVFSGMSLALLACSHSPSSKSSASYSSATSNSACVGNHYLEKYSCSIDKMEEAAQMGDPDAQYALGYMYYYGINTVQDSNTARMWINKAALQGQPLAKQALSVINNTASSPAPAAVVTKKVAVASTVKLAPSGLPSGLHQAKLLAANPNGYTLQLMASHEPSTLNQMIAGDDLAEKAHIYQAKLNNKPWYMLVYGEYPSVSAAHQALKALPASLRHLHPWIKSIKLVQTEIRTGKIQS